MALHSEKYLRALVDVLTKLERFGGDGEGTFDPQDEEIQLRLWADLRLYQAQFISAGGFKSYAIMPEQ